MQYQRNFTLAAATLLGLASSTQATVLGLPIFTVEPAIISVTNEFGPDLLPTPSYTLSFNGTIATAEGAPELVGQPINFDWFYEGGFSTGSSSPSLQIGGTEILTDPLLFDNQFLITPPYSSVFDPVTGLDTFTYTGIFAGFGPVIGTFPDLVIEFSINMPIPTREGYLYCTLGQADCEFSNSTSVTEIGGVPASLFETYVYPEGRISGATVTFSTVNGRPIAPVPLPAGGLLLMTGIFGLALAARRKA